MIKSSQSDTVESSPGLVPEFGLPPTLWCVGTDTTFSKSTLSVLSTALLWKWVSAQSQQRATGPCSLAPSYERPWPDFNILENSAFSPLMGHGESWLLKSTAYYLPLYSTPCGLHVPWSSSLQCHLPLFTGSPLLPGEAAVSGGSHSNSDTVQQKKKEGREGIKHRPLWCPPTGVPMAVGTPIAAAAPGYFGRYAGALLSMLSSHPLN